MITADQIKAARKLLGWSAATLAKKADWTLLTIVKAEAGTLQPEKVERVLARVQVALEGAGVQFVSDGVGLSEPPPASTITSAQVQEARRLLGWSRTTLSRMARIGVDTVRNAEQSTLVPRSAEQHLLAIRRTFDAAGVEFAEGGATIKFRTDEALPAVSSSWTGSRVKR